MIVALKDHAVGHDSWKAYTETHMRGIVCAMSNIGSTPFANGSRNFFGKLNLNEAIWDSSVLKAGLCGKSAMWP
jgi:hypothetical protein